MDKVKFIHDGITYHRSISDLLGPNYKCTRTKKFLNTFLREFSPMLHEKYGKYTWEITGNRYDGYHVVAVDPTRGRWNETTGFHRTPVDALRQWARNLFLV